MCMRMHKLTPKGEHVTNMPEARYKTVGFGGKNLTILARTSSAVFVQAEFSFPPPPPPPLLYSAENSLSVDMACICISDNGPMGQWAWQPTSPYPLAPFHNIREYYQRGRCGCQCSRPHPRELRTPSHQPTIIQC